MQYLRYTPLETSNSCHVTKNKKFGEDLVCIYFQAEPKLPEQILLIFSQNCYSRGFACDWCCAIFTNIASYFYFALAHVRQFLLAILFDFVLDKHLFTHVHF